MAVLKNKMIIRLDHETSDITCLADILFCVLKGRKTYYYTLKDGVLKQGGVQCKEYAARSIDDLHLIVNSYLPKVVRKTIEDIVAKLLSSEKLTHWYCIDVGKKVHMMENKIKMASEIYPEVGVKNYKVH